MTTAASADVVVVGGGHNGLVSAAYLAQAGLDVVVLEAKSRCGGALFSSTADGVTLEHGGVDHSTIVASGIVDELGLQRHGLTYRYRTLAAVHRFGDGTQLRIAETAEETAASIAAVDRRDADAWLELADVSRRLFGLLAAAGEGRPLTIATLNRLARLLPSSERALVELAGAPVTDLVLDRFRSPHVRAMAIARTTFSGLPASAPGTAGVFCLTPGGHGRRFGRPVGGSGAFISALVGAVEAAGGTVRTEEPVREIRREGEGWTVETTSGLKLRPAVGVVSAIAPSDAIGHLVTPHDAVPRRLRRHLADAVVVASNLSQFTIAAALDGRPALPPDVDEDASASMLWLLDRPADVLDAQATALMGRPPERPGVIVTFPSLTDPSLATADTSSMWINGFLARHLEGGEWTPAACEHTARAVWRTVAACLGPLEAQVRTEVFTSPSQLTDRTGAENPGTHLATTLPQLMGGRPAPGFADHRASGGLWLTGAGTGSGPGISGLPGRACAHAVLDDLSAGGLVGKLGRLGVHGRREIGRMAHLVRFVAARGSANAV